MKTSQTKRKRTKTTIAMFGNFERLQLSRPQKRHVMRELGNQHHDYFDRASTVRMQINEAKRSLSKLNKGAKKSKLRQINRLSSKLEFLESAQKDISRRIDLVCHG